MGWLETYQTLVVGLVGFAGVIATLVVNAKIARDQRREEREHEREVLRGSLIAELRINRRSLEENSRLLKEQPPDDQGGVMVPTDLIDGAYRSLIQRIGLLSDDEVSRVMWAYGALETYSAKLFLIGVPVHTSPRHVQVPAQNATYLVAMQEGMFALVDEAIEALGRARAP